MKTLIIILCAVCSILADKKDETTTVINNYNGDVIHGDKVEPGAEKWTGVGNSGSNIQIDWPYYTNHQDPNLDYNKPVKDEDNAKYPIGNTITIGYIYSLNSKFYGQGASIEGVVNLGGKTDNLAIGGGACLMKLLSGSSEGRKLDIYGGIGGGRYDRVMLIFGVSLKTFLVDGKIISDSINVGGLGGIEYHFNKSRIIGPLGVGVYFTAHQVDYKFSTFDAKLMYDFGKLNKN